MKFIIDGNYDRELIQRIKEEDLPVSHMIIHVPENPLGNSSIFLEQNLPSFEEFETYTSIVQDSGIIPVAGIDSTCQGNLEAHIEQYKAIYTLFEKLFELGYEDFLVSSPNNVSHIHANYPSKKIYVSYSQYITSLNRSKIFFELGSDYLTVHPDIIRSFPFLRNLPKLGDKISKSRERQANYILPLNLGCNWGCIYWYEHHNLQSHRTITSPIFPNQEEVSDIEDGFDYPLLNCWKDRLEDPINILKAGWISPYNIDLYKDLGYEYFLLLTGGFSAEKTIKILKYYLKGTLNEDFFNLLNIPKPYGEHWSENPISKATWQLEPEFIKDFCSSYPYELSYPFEDEVNAYCRSYAEKLRNKNDEIRKETLHSINSKLKKIEKGAVK